jgi:branched-chain amino acid transport system ATP-binding protein
VAAVLEVENVSVSFGGLVALKGVSMRVDHGEIVGLIGPNGAGKTTLLNCICGVYRTSKGVVRLEGRVINRLRPYQICRLGIARTFQIPRPFLRLTVWENVMVGYRGNRDATEHLRLVGLDRKKDMVASSLTLHERRKLEIARALATNPRLILLDEVMAGLNPVEVDEMIHTLQAIRGITGVTILWIEHVMRAVMEAAERIVVLHEGRKVAEGTPKEIAQNERVIEIYLGERYAFKGD